MASPASVPPAYPNVLKVADLDRKHPDYEAEAPDWELLGLLYAGGSEAKGRADLFLTRRPKEPAEVYAARCRRFAYRNILSQAVGWYISALFSEQPAFEHRIGGTLMEADAPASECYNEFLTNCDQRGTTFVNFWKDVFAHLAVFGRSYIMLDLPAPAAVPIETKADQMRLGALNPYLVSYDPRCVINWGFSNNTLDWAVVAVSELLSGPGIPPQQIPVDRWYFFDREYCAIYERRQDSDGREANEAHLLYEPVRHAMADQRRVPLQLVQAPEGLWLGKRALHPLMRHVDSENALDWALLMSALAVLVIKGPYKDNPEIAETFYFHVTEQGDVKWVEPSGAAIGVLKDRVRELKEEIFGSMYLMAQARSTDATPAAQSGISKQQDMMPSYEVCDGFGEALRNGMGKCLNDVAMVREGPAGDAHSFNVRGFSFQDSDEAGELGTIERVKRLEIPSDTLDRELDIKAARLAMPDATEEQFQAVANEIRTGPSKSERAAQRRQEMMAGFQASFTKATSKA